MFRAVDVGIPFPVFEPGGEKIMRGVIKFRKQACRFADLQFIPPFGAQGVDLGLGNPRADGIGTGAFEIVRQTDVEAHVSGTPRFFNGIENQAGFVPSPFEMKIDPFKGVQTIKAGDILFEGFYVQFFPRLGFDLGLEYPGRNLGTVFRPRLDTRQVCQFASQVDLLSFAAGFYRRKGRCLGGGR